MLSFLDDIFLFERKVRGLFKSFHLLSLLLVIGIIIFGGLIDRDTLNEVYRWFGGWLNLAWLGNSSDTTTVSDVGHGVSGFFLSLLLFLRWPTLGWRIFFGIAVVVAAVELGQFFIETRQPSMYDFAYSMLGVVMGCVVNSIRSVLLR